MNIHRSHQQTVDDAIRKTCRILAIIGLPVFLVSTYRNLYVDFLPLHSTLVTIIYLSFAQRNAENAIARSCMAKHGWTNQ